MYEYELKPQMDSRKSFYNKARVAVDGDVKTLTSYSTRVAKVNTTANTVIIYGTYSATTLRHIKEFLYQEGFGCLNKKQIEALM